MSHVFFFSYASENLDKELRTFFDDLCTEVAPYTPWAAVDPRVSFRDGKDLPLMEEWEPAILEALQTSSVLVCAISLAYLNKPFCGQEFWLFDQRRRRNLTNGKVPATILPIIWAPIPTGVPDFFEPIQWREGDMPATYREKGLRYLKKLDPDAYGTCVAAFADAIQSARLHYGTAPRLLNVGPFDEIPNAFAGGRWQEAAGPSGWLPGPEVANFVFVAASSEELERPPGRYSASAGDWRPYLPPVPLTISDIAREVARKNGFRYREILVDPHLPAELESAINRKNLTLVLADAQTLTLEQYHLIGSFDAHIGDGTALIMPWDDVPGPWDSLIQQTLARLFPITSQLKAPSFQGPVRSAEELKKILEATLTDLRTTLTRVETEKKSKTDVGPSLIVGLRESVN